MKNFFTILIGFFICFTSVASPHFLSSSHSLIDQGVEDLYSHSLTEEQIKITEQAMEVLKKQAVQIIFIDTNGKCFTYHNISGDVSECDIQVENLVNNNRVLNNISQESGFSDLQSKGIIPIGQVAGFGDWMCHTSIGVPNQNGSMIVSFIGGLAGVLGLTILAEAVVPIIEITSITRVVALGGSIFASGLIIGVILADRGLYYTCQLLYPLESS